ncbi:aminotransferase class I/II-fold pyridoxal phosphate-dependent enzyme [Brevibacterium yomogidense]|uniref:aminotransferase class I/II-fold pyridoxal phosphate-dependent enzyme n=1 Tax=Brevibacterium yomogidense TaxID=946573 RepID=UPI001E3CEB05|nr:aminotransferase class I/II-fold pyridoxal phosphate-dependent enzyme [Brevibacterium yomogidense]
MTGSTAADHTGAPGSRNGEQPLWHRMSDAAGLVSATGEVEETVFGRMTQLALAHDAVNLGQGAPGDPAPEFLLAAAYDAMRAGANQYAPPLGAPVLREAVAQHRRRDWGHEVDPTEVLVTAGATEALTAAIVALAPPGTDIVVLEPYYDSYAAAAALAGARLRPVGLAFDGGSVGVDFEALAAAITDRTSIVLLNTPHNPTGLVLDEQQIVRIGELTAAAGAWLLTDEVYEHLVFDGTHVAPAALLDDPRVVTVSSAGKAFNATGWKIGWLIGSPAVLEAVRAVKQYLTFTNGAPLQPAVAAALTDHPAFLEDNARILSGRRDLLVDALREVPGVTVITPESGYFVLVDFRGLYGEARPGAGGTSPDSGAAALTADAFALNEHLTREVGVTGVPAPALCAAGSPTARAMSSVIRYSFCKGHDDVAEAARRFRTFAGTLVD